MSSEFFQRLAGLDAMRTSCEVKRAWYKAQSGEPNRTRFPPYLSPIQVESPGQMETPLAQHGTTVELDVIDSLQTPL